MYLSIDVQLELGSLHNTSYTHHNYAAQLLHFYASFAY